MKQKPILIVKNLLMILFGNTLYALAVVMFILPSGLITGGTTGLALFFQRMFGVPMAVFVSVFNLLMFLIGALVISKAFALTTLVSTIYYPFILGVLQRFPGLQMVSEDRLLCAIYAGLMVGVGIGVVIRAGASTGGMDIPPLVLNKKFGIPVAVGLYVFDFAILFTQVFSADKEQVLYGLLLVLIYTTVLDKVLMMGLTRTQVKVISKCYEQINEAIIRQLDRGSTLIQSESGYCRDSGFMVMTIVANRELPRLNQLVLSIDPNAFMVINRVNEVKGRGFTLNKSYRN